MKTLLHIVKAQAVLKLAALAVIGVVVVGLYDSASAQIIGFDERGLSTSNTVTIHVNPAHSAASDNNNGTADRPVRSIGRGYRLAMESNRQGKPVRVLVHPGVYRETMSLNGFNGQTKNLITIEAVTPGQAIVTGADVWSGWTHQGNNVYTANWPHKWGLEPIPAGWEEAPKVPDIFRRRELFIVNDQPLQQVLRSSDLKPGTFLIEENRNRVTIALKSSLSSSSVVEAAIRSRALAVSDFSNLVIRGFKFVYPASDSYGAGSVVHNSKNILLENNTFAWSSGGGLGVTRSNSVTTRGNVYINNGATGYGGSRLNKLLVENDEAISNNWRGDQGGFRGWSVAGIKHLYTTNSIYRGVTIHNNLTYGLWLDTGNRDIVIERTRITSNKSQGIYLEASGGPVLLRDSIIANNGGSGIRFANIRGVTLENSILYGNSESQLLFNGAPDKRAVGGGESVYPGEDLTFRNNIIIAKGNQRVTRTYFGGPAWETLIRTLRSSGNTWYSPNSQQVFDLRGRFGTLTEWQRYSNQDNGSVFRNVCFRNPDQNDFTRVACPGETLPTGTPQSDTQPTRTQQPITQPTSQPPTSTPQPSSDLSVVRLVLVNADTQQDIRVLQPGEVIDLAKLPTRNLNVRAETNPKKVGSVKFDLNGKVRTENSEPYALFSDSNGKYHAHTPRPGSYTLHVTAYEQRDRRGKAGKTMTLNYTVINGSSAAQPTSTPRATNTPMPRPTNTAQPVNGPTVASLVLYNADKASPIMTLTDGMTINLATLPTRNLTIVATTNPAQVGSVLMKLNSWQQTENVAPYTLYGDEKNRYYGRVLNTGSYTLEVTAYTNANARGTAGPKRTVRFTLVNQQTPTPRPATSTPTRIPPTSVPPTSVPPTSVPPTSVPPTSIPPTSTPQPVVITAPQVVSYTLVNADTNQDIRTLSDGETLDLAQLPTRRLNIRANTNPPQVGSVRLVLANVHTQTENAWPYALFSDNKGDYAGRVLSAGSYTLTSIAYTQVNAQGTAGLPLTLRFTVTDSRPVATNIPPTHVPPTTIPPTSIPPTATPIPPTPTVLPPTATPIPPTSTPAPIIGAGLGLTGQYFNTPDLSGPFMLRVDPVISFNWGMNGPMPGISQDFFSVRWTGWLEPMYSELYTITTFADDGTRVWIDGQLIVNDWSKHSARDASGQVMLAAGRRYAIVLEYFDDNGSARVDLLWSSPSTPRQIIPQTQLYPAQIALPTPDVPTTTPEPVVPLPTVEPPTATPEPVVPLPTVEAPTATPEPVVPLPTVEPPTATPEAPETGEAQLPVAVNADYGQDQWLVQGAWTLSPLGAFDGISWRADATNSPATLSFATPLDLSRAYQPQLIFQSRLTASLHTATVEISTDGLWWQPVLTVPVSDGFIQLTADLTAYRGQTILLRWVWTPLADGAAQSGDNWSVDMLIVQDQPYFMPPPPTLQPPGTGDSGDLIPLPPAPES